jgi:hypothetical protein
MRRDERLRENVIVVGRRACRQERKNENDDGAESEQRGVYTILNLDSPLNTGWLQGHRQMTFGVELCLAAYIFRQS